MLQILNILWPFSAGQEFQKLKSEKKWILALVIVLVPALLSAVGNSLIEQKRLPLTVQSLEEMGIFTEEQLGFTEEQLEAMENIQSVMMIGGVVFGLVLAVILWTLKSVVFHVLSGLLGGEGMGVSSTIHVIAYTYLPLIFKGIVDVIRGLTYQPPPYEEFMNQLQNPDVFLNLVRNHNIFFAWALLLMGIAVREQFNLSNKRAAFVVVIPYIAMWIMQIAMASIGGQFMGGM